MNVFHYLYIVVDGYFVAHFTGKTEFASVNLIMPVLDILGTIGYMLGVGGSALIAKALGKGNQEEANRLFSMIVLVSFGLGVLLMAPGFLFMRQITGMLGAELLWSMTGLKQNCEESFGRRYNGQHSGIERNRKPRIQYGKVLRSA